MKSTKSLFSGQAVEWAKLRFTPYQAKWTSTETWHPEQRAHFESDGSYVLEVPYSSDSELVMDILRYGANVEVLSPQALRDKVVERLTKAITLYN